MKDLCELPFDEETVDTIECPQSCLKFDGFTSKDNRKVTVRDCGFFDADECVGGHSYEGNDAVGSLCHCHGDLCNSGYLTKSALTMTALVVAKLLLIFFI